jgi:hypothetical protein
MAQTYTLEEAAARLGITAEEMKRRLKEDWKTLRSFRDGPTLRFRATDIDELARSLGAASDPSLQLAPLSDAPPPGSDDFKVPELSIETRKPAAPDEPLDFGTGGSTEEDIFSLSGDDPRAKGGKAKGDSDVRLEVAGPKSGKQKKSDSDARLDANKKKGDSDARLQGKEKKKDDQAVVPTEEIAVDFSGPGSAVIKGGSSAKLSAPKSSTKLTSGSDSGRGLGDAPGVGDSSEFELSLDADSSDFELQLNAEQSDEVDLGSSPVEEEKKSGQSGINLRDPADSGISLEKKGKEKAKPKAGKDPDTDSDSDIDFELSLEGPLPTASGTKHGTPKSGPRAPLTSDSDSEFELTLDDSGEGSSLEAAALESDAGKNDIFETDFEIPPMESESGSEAVAVESDTDLEQSDFDLAVEGDSGSDETGSQVVLLEEEEAPKPARGKKRPAAAADVELDSGEADVAVEDESDAATALKGAKGRRRPAEEEEEEEEAAPVAAAAPAPWGPIPAIFLFLAFIFTTLGGLMGYELVQTMWGYQQPRKPAAPLVRGVANTLDMDVKDQ